jgi:hypothetical protein
MKLAIMQPYFFPYIGYFQLVNAADKFVFYDDVNYIKKGWINRNRILLNEKSHYITVCQKGASQNKLIKDIEIIDNRGKLKKTIQNAYSKAPNFKNVWALIEDVLEFKTNSISELAAYSVIQTCNYLGIDTEFEFSSEVYMQTSVLKSENRLIEICKINNATDYINPIGGMELYDKNKFLMNGINLSFLKTDSIVYKQLGSDFIENLSIIDVLMFNDARNVALFLDSYDLL